jgi:hypothetical protein
LTTVAWVLAGVVALLLVLLAAPVILRLEVHGHERIEGQAHLTAVFGVVKTDLRSATSKTRDRSGKRRTPRRRRPSARGGFAALRTEGLAAAVRRLVGRLWRSIHVRHLDGLVVAGLEDPADTGMAWGLVGPVLSLTSQRWPDFRAEPCFDSARFEVDARGTLSVVPLRVLLVLLGFLFTPAVMRALVAAWRAR